MATEAEKTFHHLPLFRPEEGKVVFEPEANGPGYWVGAPAVVFDSARQSFLMCYRRRRPRDQNPDRGYQVAIAESKDGVKFEDIWTLKKEQLDTTSIEKACILRGHDDVYRYYISYVDPADNCWRTDVVEADNPENLDISTRQEVFTAKAVSRYQSAPIEGVKDPNVYLIGHIYYMFLSCAEGAPSDTALRGEMHSTSDVFNTGLLVAPSAYATSTDGVRFRWQGKCLPVGDEGSWDGYQSRLNSVMKYGNLWYGFYDGIHSYKQNYEEHFGLAQSIDLVNWTKISTSRPLITVPWQSGSVRYTEALRVAGNIHYYYEMVRKDGAHELRCAIVPAAEGS